jgi:hypothetical protein
MRIALRVAASRFVPIASCVMALAVAVPVFAQVPQNATDSRRPFEITDNSFFVEEAFNQEPGIFQNIFGVQLHGRGDWDAAFTQEWPLFSQRHQISYTIPYASAETRGIGDVLVNYRLQVTNEGQARPAFSPRLSLIAPTGDSSRNPGSGRPGWEVNLPVSKQFGDLYLHGNAGFTRVPFASDNDEHSLKRRVAASAIWRARPMLNLMLESVVEWDKSVESGATTRSRNVTVAPGLRTGRSAGDAQIIFGVAMPVAFSDGETEVGAFGYFSYELPFTH